MDFGIGFSEMIVILVLVLVFFGSKEIPHFVREAGKILGKVRRYSDTIKRELDTVTRSLDLKDSPQDGVSSVQTRKREMRQKYRQLLAEMPLEDRQSKSKTICDLLLAAPEFTKAKAVMVYISQEMEVDTQAIVDAVIAAGKRCVVPFCRDINSSILGIAAITDPVKELQKGSFDIMEPIEALRDNFFKSDLNLILCPGLAFDEYGARLGRGKGYYDNFLRELKGKITIFGLAFQCQIDANVPFSYNDVKVDLVLTEMGRVSKTVDTVMV
jgi:5-formyltetrahydrofolate cyclo-ligase